MGQTSQSLLYVKTLSKVQPKLMCEQQFDLDKSSSWNAVHDNTKSHSKKAVTLEDTQTYGLS